MKIIIVGAGRVGTNLSISLAAEDNEVYLVEADKTVGQKLAEKLDVKVVVGNGADPDTLKKANVEEADLVLAVTSSDETNLVVCSFAAFFGAKRRIARVRNTALSTTLSEIGYKQFSINEIINPELLAADSILKTIETPGASEVADFSLGKILLRGFDIPINSPLAGARLEDFSDENFPWPFLIISILRNGKVFIPKGDSEILAGDHIYTLLPNASLAEFLTFVDPGTRRPKKVVVYGATITGVQVVKLLTKKIKDIVLIEEDEDLAREVAGEVPEIRVIKGTGYEADILTESGVEAADAFVAATNNDHSNLISAVLAKKMGAKVTIITTQQPEYLSIINEMDISAIVNPHFLAVKQILHLARGRTISSVTKLVECDGEALELIAEEGSPITLAPLKDIRFPKDCIVGAVDSLGEAVLASGETRIKPKDKAIVFCMESAIKPLQKLFTRS